MIVECPVSIGELVDKLSILDIKSRKIEDGEKVKNAREEFSLLKDKLDQLSLDDSIVQTKFQELVIINEQLWDIEDQIREKEREKKFDDEFVKLARSVYKTNDQRFILKDQLNEACGSDIREVKSYEKYD